MTRKHTVILLVLLATISGLNICGPATRNSLYLVSFHDSINDGYGYKNQNGDIVIPPGKYAGCLTDTFKTYAIVVKPNSGFIAIDRHENIMYEIFPYDNGPDYTSDGLFRIVENNKIGFADSTTGKVIIKPQFDCAWPFENGIAEVSTDCRTQPMGEHSFWVSDNWFYIDKTGKKLEKQRTIKE